MDSWLCLVKETGLRPRDDEVEDPRVRGQDPDLPYDNGRRRGRHIRVDMVIPTNHKEN